MPSTVRCPACGQPLAATPGQIITCQCGRTFRVRARPPVDDGLVLAVAVTPQPPPLIRPAISVRCVDRGLSFSIPALLNRWWVAVALALAAGWLCTTFQPPPSPPPPGAFPWVAANYLLLAVLAAFVAYQVGWRLVPKWAVVISLLAAPIAVSSWASLDFYLVFERDGDIFHRLSYGRFSDTPYYRRSHSSQRPYWSAAGPTDHRGRAHGKWHLYDRDQGDHERWYYHGDQITAVEWQAMRAD